MARVTAGAVMETALRVMDVPFKWGCCDCCTAACDVFRELHGIDPMAAKRGGYAGPRGAAVMIAAEGGWLPFVDAVAADAGLIAVDTHEPGDLGLTVLRGGSRSLAICVGPGVWAAKSRMGLALVTDVERAWRAV